MYAGRAAVRPTVRAQESLRTAAQRMDASGLTCLVALDGSTPIGVVTDGDLVRASLCGGLAPGAPIAALAWRPLVTAARGERADETYRLMNVHGLRHLPLSAGDGRIVGMLALEDALVMLLQDLVGVAAGVGLALGLGDAVLRAEDTRVALPAIDGAAPARALAALLQRENADALLVLEGSRPAGFVSERDLLGVVAGRGDPDATRAGELVREPFAAVDPHERLEAVVELMASRGVDRVAVARGRRVLGMVSLNGLLAGLAYELAKLLARAARSNPEALRARPILH